MKYYGRDINLVEAYQLFKDIHERYIDECARRPPETKMLTMVHNEHQFRIWFMRALSDLKFMGIVSTTRQNTFVFKKNIFGKARLHKNLAQQDKQAIESEVQTYATYKR